MTVPDRGGAENDPVTLGEVARNLVQLAEQMERGFAHVEDRFNNLAMVHSDVYVADRHTDTERRRADQAHVADVENRLTTRVVENEKRLGRIEGNISWLGRAIIGAFILAAAGALVAASGWPH